MINELIVYSNPKCVTSEAIKSIKINLQFASVDKDIKTIMITSSMPGEGKSFIAANLACAFVEDKKRVLLVDCDLRRGRQHRIFKQENIRGLSNLLLEDLNNLENYVTKLNDPKITLMTCGTIPPNPSELLNSNKNKALVEFLKKSYDLVIFDCPPVQNLSDPLIMSTLVDSTLVVCSQNQTPIDLLESTKKSLEQVSANINGVVFNNITNKISSYYNEY